MRDEADLPTLPADGTSGDGVVAMGATAPRYGRFVSRGVIGQGGMGVVLRAHDPELDRHVAIKVLTPGQLGSNDPTGAQRLQREAQAMAKLSHPNVVAVYDTGQVEGARYIVMELVEGSTLRRWLVGKRTPEDVIEQFIACGRGLAAAHAAGLVHRDFKPENVLIGADGRPQVSDFGLVAAGVRVEGTALGTSGVSSNLTVDGAVIGTPAYMAPEQWSAGEVDARTDQFAFCVALWEGLYGERPFAGRTGNELRDNVLAGKVREVPRDKRVPRRIADIVRRGLSADRAARWPSMNELLAALEAARRRRWPWIALGASVLVAAVAVTVLATGGTRTHEPCPDPGPRLAGVWDAATATRVKAAFLAASPDAGKHASERTIAELDEYAGAWRAMTLAACRATAVEHSQSPQLLDQRMVCLDRRLAELGALTSVLVSADRERVNRAIDAAGALVDLETCADNETLLADPPPTDPGLRRRVAEVDLEIAAAHQLMYGADLAERQKRASAAVAKAREVGYPPLLVRALEELYFAASVNSDHPVAEASLRELAQRAATGHDDRRAATAWINLINLLAMSHERDEAKALVPVAEAAVGRAGSPQYLSFNLVGARGTLHLYAGELDEAVAAYTEALRIAPQDAHRVAARQGLAQAVYLRDGPKGALSAIDAAAVEAEKLYGPVHPILADALELKSQMLAATGDLDRALELQTKSLTIREAALNPGHREIAMALHHIANIEVRRGNRARARELYLRAIPIFEAAQRADDAALARAMLGGLVADEDGMAAARPYYDAGLAGLARSFGDDSIQYVHMESNLAQRLIDADLCTEAQPHIDHVISVLEKKMPRDLPLVLGAVFVCDVKAKRVDVAIAKLERARELCSSTGCDFPEDLAFDLGKLLYDARRGRTRARALVEDAARLAAEHGATEVLADIDAWRKAHR